MNKKFLALIVITSLSISFTLTIFIPSSNIDNITKNDPSLENNIPEKFNTQHPLKEQLIGSKSFSLPGISSLFTYELYKSQIGLSLHIDGNGKPIYIRNSNNFEILKEKMSEITSTPANIKSFVIKNAPGSILENFQFSVLEPSNPLKFNKINTIEENKTVSSPFNLIKDDNSIIRNMIYTGVNASSVIQILGCKNVQIYNNTFRDIAVDFDNFYAVRVYSIEGISSSGTQIYNNTFRSITTNSSSTILSLEGDSNLKIQNIYVANNNITNVKANYGSLTTINITYGNNITIFNNTISNINTNSTFNGITDHSTTDLNITLNSFSLIYAMDKIVGIKANQDDSISISNNLFNIFASTNSNVTGISLSDSNNLNLIENTLTQFIASYDSFDFSESKIVNGIIIKNSIGSSVINNSITQLSSKSKAYSLTLANFQSGLVLNNSIIGIDSKSSSGIILDGTSNPDTIINFNTISNIVSSATDTIGIYSNYASNINVINNSISNLEGSSNLYGITVENSPFPNIINNSLSKFSTNSPVYDLYGIRVINSDNSIISKNFITNLYSQLTFVGVISIEDSTTITLSFNSISNSQSDFSSAFGILLSNDNSITLNNNTIYNITSKSTPQFSLLNNKMSKTSLSVTLSGGFGLFILQSDIILVDSNFIDLTNYWLNIDETVTNIAFANNIVDSTELTFVSMTHPADDTFEQGSQTANVTWIAQDPSAYLYSIYVDSQLASNGFWYNNIPIVFGVSDINTLSLGHHEIQIVLTDSNNHKINDIVNVNVVEFTAPIFISSLTNTTILNGTLGNSLSWSAYDLNPGQYFLYRNGTLVTSSTWTSNFPISASIDDLTPGTYNFTIVVKDSSLNEIQGTRFVYVLTNGSILFNLKPNSAIISNFGSKNTTLSWIISSIQGGLYSINVDGTIIHGTWTPNTPIYYTLPDLSLGEHSVTFTVTNSFTLATQVLIVTVIIPQTETTNTTSNVPTLPFTTTSFNLLNIIKINTTNLFFLLVFILLVGGTLGFLYYNRYKQYQSRNYINKSERIEQLIEIGKAQMKMGDNLKAIKTFKKALRGAILINDVRLKAQIQVNLGYVGLQLKDKSSIESSLNYLNEALESSRSIKDKTIQVYCHSYLGDYYTLISDPNSAITNYEKGIKLAEELDDEALGIQILKKLGLYYHHLGSYPDAIKSFDQGLILSDTIKDFKSEMNFNYFKGNSLLQQNDNANAIVSYNNALKIAQRLNDITNQAKITGELGRAYYQMEKSESKALKHYSDSIDLAKMVGDLQVEAYQNRNIAILQFEQGKYDEALSCIEVSLNFEKSAQFLNLKANCLIGQKNIPIAIDFYKKALASAKKNNELQLESEILQKLIMIETKLLHEEKAIRYREELDSLLPEISEWEQKLSSKISKLKIVTSIKADERIFTLISENIEPDPYEIEKIKRESERLEKINRKEVEKEKSDKKDLKTRFNDLQERFKEIWRKEK